VTLSFDPARDERIEVTLHVNGREHRLAVGPFERLLDVLRERLALTGTKEGCGEGECGACTVLLDGKPALSCLLYAWQVEGRAVTTIEGLAGADRDPVQRAYVEAGAVQCGFCTPGLVLSSVALLQRDPDPSEQAIREGLSGNLCRCTGYAKIVQAVQRAAALRRADPATARGQEG